MNILIINSILFTPEKGCIPTISTIKDTMIYNLCLGFQDIGHNVTLIAADDYLPSTKEKYPFEILFLPSVFKQLFNPTIIPFHPKLLSILKHRRNEFDLVITSENFQMNTLITSLFMRSKMVIWQEMFHHQKLFKQIPSKIWHNIIFPIFLKRVLVIPRSHLAMLFIQKYTCNFSHEYIEHGVNLNKFDYSIEKKDQFISIAQLIERKQVDKVISAFAKFITNPNRHNFILHIAGRGHLEKQLKEQVDNLGIVKNVIFHGHLPHSDLNLLLRESKASLIYTKQDINMVSVPEAIASGTPIVMTSVPSTASWIQEINVGIVDDCWDENTLESICEKSNEFVTNCVKHRHQLSSTYSAEQFMKIFKLYFH